MKITDLDWKLSAIDLIGAYKDNKIHRGKCNSSVLPLKCVDD